MLGTPLAALEQVQASAASKRQIWPGPGGEHGSLLSAGPDGQHGLPVHKALVPRRKRQPKSGELVAQMKLATYV